jgi:hypothetical protein
MKVRWTDESLRLRITPTELAALVVGEPLRATLAIPGGAEWSVVVRPNARSAALRASDGVMEVCLTTDDVWRLTDGDAEGIYFTTGRGEGAVRYFVEKDFPCAHPHAAEAREPETERFAPTEAYLRRKRLAGQRP